MGKLTNVILSRPNMREAWEQVQANRSKPGIDRVTLARWGRNWEANIERLRHQVRTNTYRPNRPKRFTIRKKGGGTRELSMLTVTDKVMQRAVLNKINPLFDGRFLPCSHGYRPKRSVGTAVEQVLNYRDGGLRFVLDADIEACFDSLDHTILMSLIRRRISDWFVLNLTALWLKAGRKYRKQAIGVPMGGVLSPLWANIYLHPLDAWLNGLGFKVVRYADDFLVLCASESDAQIARTATERALAHLNLHLAAHKTCITNFEDGFVFLGVTFHKETYAYIWEQKKIKVKGRKLNLLYKHLPKYY